MNRFITWWSDCRDNPKSAINLIGDAIKHDEFTDIVKLYDEKLARSAALIDYWVNQSKDYIQAIDELREENAKLNIAISSFSSIQKLKEQEELIARTGNKMQELGRESLVLILKGLKAQNESYPKNSIERKFFGKKIYETCTQINAIRPKKKFRGIENFIIEIIKEDMENGSFNALIDKADKRLQDYKSLMVPKND